MMQVEKNTKFTPPDSGGASPHRRNHSVVQPKDEKAQFVFRFSRQH